MKTFEDHAAIGGVLTDHRITHYMLSGAYGEERQEQAVVELCAGRLGRFAQAVREGKYGQLIAQRFANSKGDRRKRKASAVSYTLEDFI